MSSRGEITIFIEGIENGQPVPERCARCVSDGKGQSMQGENIRPAIRWDGAPEATQSYVILMVDKDVPTNFDLANKQGKTIPLGLPRRNFYHWVQINIPADVTEIPEGPAGMVEPGISGYNSYEDRGTDQGMGYDGPCPPWNDERLHHYHFVVYALDVPSLGLTGRFTGDQVEEAIESHILARGEIIGTYTTNKQERNAA